ncbi:MAG: OmpA family protein [Bacteroidales bacterium]|nr:OmpA family protein [Bacteroidales bacterium]
MKKLLTPAVWGAIIFPACMLLFTPDGKAQSENLVLNFSFEEYETCPQTFTPQNLSHILIPGWTYPTKATPDYFNSCSPVRQEGVSVPNNFAGESRAKSGEAYAGAILSGTDDGYREYIQGTLKEPLVAGMKYCVNFSYKLASYSKFAVDQLSLLFLETEVRNDLMVNLAFKPQINNQEGLFLDNIDEWEDICTVYEASGNEQYFIIGNFKSYDNTNYVATDKSMKNLMNKEYAYYYFDDIIIRPLENCTDCPCVHHDFEAEIIDSGYTGGFNPMTGTVPKIKNDGYIKIGMVGGTPPYRVLWDNGMKGNEVRGLPAGKYSYTAYDAFNCQSTGKVIFTAPEILFDEFEEGLQTIEEGQSIVLENIFFEFNKTTLLPESFPELNKVAAFIKDNHISLIEIGGHTDSEGSDSYNQKLSEGRAQSVVAYLTGQGILAQTLQARGYGESRPIDTNITEEGRAVNRRVEFTLLKK